MGIFWHEWPQADWGEKGNVIVIAVTNNEERGSTPQANRDNANGANGANGTSKIRSEKAVGVAVWQRKGDDEHAQRVKDQ